LIREALRGRFLKELIDDPIILEGFGLARQANASLIEAHPDLHPDFARLESAGP